MGVKTVIAIHQWLEKRDKDFWHHYWGDDLEIFKDYPKFILNLAAAIVEASAKRIFIIHEDRALFLAGFLAALLTETTIILPNTNAAGALKELTQPGDIFLKEIIQSSLSAPSLRGVKQSRSGLRSSARNDEVCARNDKICFFTSGSTAAPKIIVKSLRQLEAEIATLEKMWGPKNSDIRPRFFSTVSHSHIYGLLFSLLWPVSANYKIVRTTLLDWETIAEKCCANDYLVSSPSLLERRPPIINEKIRLNKIFSSGSELKFHHAIACEASFGILPVEVYGSTETGGIAYRQQFQQEEPWQKFECVTLKTDERQVLSVQSPYILETDFYETNDRVHLINDSLFYLMGRVDRIVKVEGKRVSLNSIEEKLCSLAYIESAKVILLEEGNRDELGAAIVLSKQGHQCLVLQGKLPLIKSIKNELKNYVESVSIPKRWRFVESFPVNTEGKITSTVLKNLFKQEITSC